MGISFALFAILISKLIILVTHDVSCVAIENIVVFEGFIKLSDNGNFLIVEMDFMFLDDLKYGCGCQASQVNLRLGFVGHYLQHPKDGVGFDDFVLAFGFVLVNVELYYL